MSHVHQLPTSPIHHLASTPALEKCGQETRERGAIPLVLLLWVHRSFSLIHSLLHHTLYVQG